MRLSRLGAHCFTIAAAAALLAPLSEARAQSAPHLVSVKLVDKPGGQFAFEPATIVAQRGDTVRFVQVSSAPHNVHFKSTPKGAKLGAATSGPYLIALNSTYDLVVDARFIDGTYGIICDPHESVGMRATMTVGAAPK
ncbi:MAG: plastocyanin/azurin family copper-binding protein [Gemmatimonadota bacterium]|nr:plastocyanin/azurin family copper-binding protein [Gemmatimonadota bacterium]